MSISKDFFIHALKYDGGSYSIMKALTIISAAIVILVLSAMLLSAPASAEDVRHAEAYRHIRVVVGDASDTTAMHANVSVRMAAILSSEAQTGEGAGAWSVILLISGINIVFLALALRKRPGRIGLKKRK